MKQGANSNQAAMGVDPQEAYNSSRRHVAKQNFAVGGSTTVVANTNSRPAVEKKMTAVTAITFNP